MRPERVLLLTTGFSGLDGISTMARETARALTDPRWSFEVWSLVDQEVPGGRGAGGKRSRFSRWTLGETLGPRPGRLLVLALHLHLAVAALPLRARGARVGLFLHGIEAWGALSLTRGLALASAAPLLSNSRYTADRVRSTHSAWVRSPIRPCHLGLADLARHPGPSPVPPGFVLSVGRLSSRERYKGTDALLDAWPEVARELRDARLVVVGDGDDRARLEERARPLGDRVRFLGRVEPELLTALYSDCALFALPSTGEGFGLVYLEAMRAGKTVVAGPGAPEEVVTAETGVIVDPRASGQLARALVDLLSDGALRDRLGAAGRARFLERFTAEHFARRLRACLEL